MLPGPPWAMEGETVVVFVRGQSASGALPAGLRPLPGPAVLVAERHAHSPAGPFLTMVLGRPARLGARAGFCFTAAGVSATESRAAGRVLWGFPGEPATIDWRTDADEIVVSWHERAIELRAEFPGRAVPLALPFRVLQVRGDEPVVVPGRLRGRVRWGRAEVAGFGDSRAHRAIHVAGLRLVLRAARAPSGRLARLRAPAPGAEPGFSFSPSSSRASRVPGG